ncbi:MAG TPA: YwiC-like family protein [Terracidiphilus sp.]|nr:YwiC-like family protein [Terracidiphilus sp.]
MQPAVQATDRPMRKARFFPREHGATAMLLTPIVCAAVLARTWRWSELATLTAAFAALAAKDPLVVLVRQRLVWKQPHAETPAAARWFAGWALLFGLSGLVLLRAWPMRTLLGMSAGMAAYAALAVRVNVKNRQRSVLFQIASAAALSSSALACAISALGTIPAWCWWLWVLLSLHATVGILVVHARLDARVAPRSPAPGARQSRRTALAAVAVVAGAALAAAVLGRWWIALALAVAAAGFDYDLRSQRDAAALQMPLMRVGRRALTLAVVFALLVILGLW